jgi:PAS domain S-box-containing protein
VTNPPADSTTPADLAAHLRALYAQVSAADEVLHRQADLLRLRAIVPPAELFAALGAAAQLLQQLAVSVTDAQTELEQLRSLSVTSALINSSLDADTVLAQALDELLKLTGAERGFVVLGGANGDALDFRIARGLNTADLERADVSRTLLRRVLGSGQAVLTDNAAADPRLAGSDTVAKFALRSVMCVPLLSKGVVEGAIYVDNRLKTGLFTERDLTLLVAFANQAAIALHNATLYTRVQETMGQINRARALSEQVFASVGSGIITADSRNRILTLNAAAAAILRCTEAGAVGQPLTRVLPLKQRHLKQIRGLRESGGSASFEAQPDISGRGRIMLSIRVSPLQAADGRAQGTTLVLDDRTEHEEREETLRLMTRYLPPGMVEHIDKIADLGLGGERRVITCAFITTCSFSRFPPGLRPAETMAMLNIYLDTATTCVHKARGVIDKYMGSDMMVLFNTQLNPESAHSQAAVEMALDMRAAFEALYRRMGADPAAHHYAIGIHTGVATLGNVGSLRRRSFTALGDTINLARRVQESAGPGQILLTGDAAEFLHTGPDSALRLEARPALQARGRQQATPIFEVIRA